MNDDLNPNNESERRGLRWFQWVIIGLGVLFALIVLVLLGGG